MKNLLFLGAIALLLFSLSAALSLWLNQSRQEVQAEKDKEKEKLAAKTGANGGTETKAPEPKTQTPGKLPPLTSPNPDLGADQEKLARKAVQLMLVQQDVQAQREATDNLLRQVAVELKAASAAAPDPDAKKTEALKKQQAEDLRKQQAEARASEKKNLEKLADIYNAMSPERAAPILKAMAESGVGKMEQAAQILALMKDRNSARLLEAMNDDMLAAQLFNKMREMKALAPAPSPVGGVQPAGGP